jgi:valyl-tRNA synthetase
VRIIGQNLPSLKLTNISKNRSTRNLEKEYPQGIPPCGTDSLRFALVQYTQQSRQINLDISNVIQTSYFCNKLWNLFKFGLGRLENQPLKFDSYDILSMRNTHLSLANRFILSRMADTISKCQTGFESSRLFEATDALRRFIVEDVCDIYVEFSKSALSRSDLADNEKVQSRCMRRI